MMMKTAGNMVARMLTAKQTNKRTGTSILTANAQENENEKGLTDSGRTLTVDSVWSGPTRDKQTDWTGLP